MERLIVGGLFGLVILGAGVFFSGQHILQEKGLYVLECKPAIAGVVDGRSRSCLLKMGGRVLKSCVMVSDVRKGVEYLTCS